MKNKPLFWQIAVVVVAIAALSLASHFLFFRLDLTSDKRYTLSPATKKLMKSLEEPVQINVYLDGDLNAGFLRLKRSCKDYLEEFKVYAGKNIQYQFVDPTKTASGTDAEAYYASLEKRGMKATMVYEKDADGKAVRKIIFPWAEIISHKDTLLVNLLTNVQGRSGEENLNASVEGLEYQLTDAIRVLNVKETRKIAFLEGNGELPEPEVYDATTALSRYFQVDRGALGNDPKALDPYKVVIVAKPVASFSENEKFILDQYIMRGGSILWLIDGSRIDNNYLAQTGQATIAPLDVNLADMLFGYGIRINPDIVQDVQCASMPVNVSRPGDEPQFKPMPWFYQPLLLTSPYHVVTRNLASVKANFASSIDFVGVDTLIKKTALLATSNASHVLAPPAMVDLKQMPDPRDHDYFQFQNIPVGGLLEGSFTSAFANRMVPEGIIQPVSILRKSKTTRMIVIANGDIIRNEVHGTGNNMQILPLGFDSYANRQYGNRDFIVNAVLYLCGDDHWLELRSRVVPLRLLNNMATTEGRIMWQITNLVIPLILLALFAAVFFLLRRRKYSR
ncbi:MAG: gliding-associated putative transporter substrate-binding component GldG [Bacteroidetes bacterium]|jgi:ABC-2 type transport system permease protein|nr:gliding-associated putative transporter substrate-binding component GldG [Bacteroidota bacterium]